MITVSGNNARQVFSITAPFTVAISGLTIANGAGNNVGSGISNGGRLTITDCIVSDNSSINNGAGSTPGAGIYNSSTLTIINSTLRGNTASDRSGGGGIYNTGMLTVTNSTLSDNSSDYAGGGLWNNGGTVTLTNSTFSGNYVSPGLRRQRHLQQRHADRHRRTFNDNETAVSGGGIYNGGR